MASREDVLSTQETFLKEVADAIRDKEGTNELIAPVDFPSRIRAISTAVVDNFPAGGAINQALMKNSGEDGDVRWGNVVVTFNGRSGFVYPQEGDYTADDVGAVPTYRRVNGHELESDIWLTAEDVDALSEAQADQKFGAIDARFDNAEMLIGQSKTESVATANHYTDEQVALVKLMLEQFQSSMQKSYITYGTSALVSNISSLDTGTIYVQYEA